MDIQSKHTDTILRAKIKVVSIVDLMYKKMSYGEDVGCVNSLYAAILLINRLECYSFDTPNYNCIENSDLPKMYEVLQNLLK